MAFLLYFTAKTQFLWKTELPSIMWFPWETAHHGCPFGIWPVYKTEIASNWISNCLTQEHGKYCKQYSPHSENWQMDKHGWFNSFSVELIKTLFLVSPRTVSENGRVSWRRQSRESRAEFDLFTTAMPTWLQERLFLLFVLTHPCLLVGRYSRVYWEFVDSRIATVDFKVGTTEYLGSISLVGARKTFNSAFVNQRESQMKSKICLQQYSNTYKALMCMALRSIILVKLKSLCRVVATIRILTSI